MILHQGYKHMQTASYRQPNLDYPYLGLQDEDEDDLLEILQY